MSGKTCIFGEVLYDHFPDGRRVLGGAPFNVAWHLQALGEKPLFISRVGADDDGDSIRQAMQESGMTRAGLQVDGNLPTGQVKVSLLDGEPSYDIVHPSAWDAIEAPGVMPELQLLYHGSLALRSDVSKRTCRQIRNSSPGLVFVDVNLRAPWWSIEQVREDILGADWIKMNREEFDILMPGGSGVLARAEKALIDHELQGILLTDGSRGAELLTVGGEHESVQPANGLEVVDTVGAGDAMASVVVLGLLRGWPLGPCLEQAQVFASMIVGQRGATIRDSHFYQSFIDRCISRGLDI